MFKISAFLLFLLVYFPVTGQVISDSVLVEGHYRTFHFNRPAANLKNSSLIFILHGSGGNGRDTQKGAQKLEVKAGRENLLLVYPDGYKRYWNECRKTANSPANLENINEQAFFQAMINYFQKNYQVNKSRVFAIGTSGGGHMAYKLALTMPQKFKAVTAIIANLPTPDNLDCAEARVPVSVMIINGTLDTTNPYNGGLVVAGNVTFGNVRSTDNTFRYWAQLAGYTGEPVKENLPNTDVNDGKTIERYRYQKKGKPEVVLLKVIGGKHDYPNDIDVYEEAWAFFKRQ